jgi:NTE family protein
MADLAFLSTIPIFAFFTREELEAAEKRFEEASFPKDAVVTRIGEPGEVFYVILDGELEVWDGNDPPNRTGTLSRGDFFGEMALLQGGKRTATVTVSRRARLLSVNKDAFEELFLRNPKAIEYFARVLSKRLAGLTRGDRGRRSTTTISVASRQGRKGETALSLSLGAVLRDLTGASVLCVEVRPSTERPSASIAKLLSDDLQAVPDKIALQCDSTLPATLQAILPQGLTARAYGDLLSNLVSKLSDSFNFIVFDLGSDTPGLIESAGEYSDVFVGIVDGPDDEPGVAARKSLKVFKVINLFNPSSQPVPISSSEPFVLPFHPALGLPPMDAATFICAHPRSNISLPIYRLARKMLGASVGLALGGGAAFGIAHLGVLKVLEANHIPIDLVAGCSQGSIVAVGYAAGLHIDEMIHIAKQLGIPRNFVFASDPTFFLQPGLLAGQRFLTMMRPYLRGRERFEELLLPCRTVATDIQTGERVPIGTGRLETAFRASSSVPMVLAPLKVGERVLVDGGVADPVPAEVASEMGADLTIAVNVVPRLKRGVETALSYWFRRINTFNPMSYINESQDLPNMFDIIMNSMQVLQYELGNFKAITADVLINPDLSDFTWIEYYRADELIARGAEAAERALPAIHKAIEGKIAPFRPAAPAPTLVSDAVPRRA